jgi:hypothetical protein
MRLRRSVLASVGLALLVTHLLVLAIVAAPNPDTNKNAVLITVHCESGDFMVASIAQNAAVAAQIVGGRTAVIMWAELFDNPEFSGEPVFSFGNRGFGRSALETETCTVSDNPAAPGLFMRAEMLILRR